MKRFSLLLFFVSILYFHSGILKGQDAYYDALTLSKTLDSKKQFGQIHLPLFYNYYSTAPTDQQVAMDLSKNPFLKNYYNPASTASLPSFLSSSSIAQSVGGLNVTSFADGLAKFLVKRTKEELSVTFFNQFLDDLNKNPQLKQLFPNSYNVLNTIEDQIYNYAAYIGALKTAFERDMSSLGSSIKLLDSNKVGSALDLGFSIAQQLSSGTHPSDLLNTLAIPHSVSNTDKDLANAAQILRLFSNSLRSKNSGHFWISSDSLQLLLNNDDALRLYFGLIYLQNQNTPVVFSNGSNFSDVLTFLASNLDKIEQYKTYLYTLIQKAENTDLSLLQLKNLIPKDRTYNDYYQLYTTSLNFLSYLPSVGNLPGFPSAINLNTPQIQKTVAVLNLTGNTYLDVNQKKYSSVVMDVSSLLDTLLGAKYTWKTQFIKYGSFMAAVALAENSDDIETAIEAVAMPAGSASVKKASSFSISLNAYVGGFAGREFLADKSKNKWGTVGGITAPVGIGFNWGIGKKCKSSISVFASVIDIGAIASYRFNNDSTATLPSLTLQNILAPGLSLVYGLPKWPVSIGLGYQLGPVLRTITATEKNISSQPNGRAHAFIAVDIPVIHFYTKPKTK
jgi:hypothetical protein